MLATRGTTPMQSTPMSAGTNGADQFLPPRQVRHRYGRVAGCPLGGANSESPTAKDSRRDHPLSCNWRPLDADAFRVLQVAKRLSSTRIIGPADVLAIELFGGRQWQPATISDG